MADRTHEPYERDRAESAGEADVRPGTTGPAGYEFSYEADAPRAGDPDAGGPNGRTVPRDRSLPSLLKELSNESATLVRQEVALAKAELSEKAAVAGRNAAAVAVGAAVATAGAMLLLFGLAFTLYFALWKGPGLSPWLAGILAFPVLGAVIALVGYGMIRKGINTLKHTSPVPEKTVQTLKEDKQWLANQVK